MYDDSQPLISPSSLDVFSPLKPTYPHYQLALTHMSSFSPTDFAAVTENYTRTSPPKADIAKLPLLVERESGPGLGFSGDRGHWYEVEEEDGHASWTAFAASSNETLGRGRTQRNSAIIVQECRW